MSLYFGDSGYENLFKQALNSGINLFCGAGFSIEAEDAAGKKLPVGDQLLTELKERFPTVASYTKLPRACTKLIQTDKASFYSFLNRRFSVKNFSPLYTKLLKINIRNIYTTNIDDLFFEIYKDTEKLVYLNDSSIKGTTYGDNMAINYFPLHGCVKSEGDYVFGATEIASAFSKRDKQQSWRSLAKDSAQHPILFWGWNFEDAGPIEAMFGSEHNINENINKWVLLYSPTDEMVDYLQSLQFSIIIGDTVQMLEYIDQLHLENQETGEIKLNEDASRYLEQFQFPRNNEGLPSYPLSAFFIDYMPRWSHIFSGEIPKLSHYKKIADYIASEKDIFVIGIRASGKTTLLMQLIINIAGEKIKHHMVAPTLAQVQSYLKSLNGHRAVLFVDDCLRDTNAVIELLKAPNVQAVLFDRDFNFERQYHKIQRFVFECIDITEITKEDAQNVINIIPSEIKRKSASTRKFEKDPTLLNLLATNLKAMNFNFMTDFYGKDPEAARVFLMICYVHSCGVPCSFDMIYSFLGDDKYSWEEMYDIIKGVGGLIQDCSEYFGAYDIMESVQDYYKCRTRFFAEKIMESIPAGNTVLADVLFDFACNVPSYKICQYDKFKRSGYDADITTRAFVEVSDGEKFYTLCTNKDDSEYIYQQAAIYLSRKKKFKEAFIWIDKARNMAHYNRFSIDSTYAQLYFDANLETDQTQAEKALDILGNCCKNDKRKSIHFSAYAKRVIKFNLKYPGEKSLEYINTALLFIKDGLDSQNLSLSQKNKWDLKSLKEELESAKIKI